MMKLGFKRVHRYEISFVFFPEIGSLNRRHHQRKRRRNRRRRQVGDCRSGSDISESSDGGVGGARRAMDRDGVWRWVRANPVAAEMAGFERARVVANCSSYRLIYSNLYFLHSSQTSYPHSDLFS